MPLDSQHGGAEDQQAHLSASLAWPHADIVAAWMAIERYGREVWAHHGHQPVGYAVFDVGGHITPLERIRRRKLAETVEVTAPLGEGGVDDGQSCPSGMLNAPAPAGVAGAIATQTRPGPSSFLTAAQAVPTHRRNGEGAFCIASDDPVTRTAAEFM